MNPVLRQAQVAGAAASIGRARQQHQAVVSTLEEELASERSASVAAGFAQGLREGREEGLRAGHAEGVALGRAEAARAAQVQLEAAMERATAPLLDTQRRLAALLSSVQDASREALLEAEEDMVALCFQAICRVLGDTAVTQEGVQAQVRTLLAARTRQEPLVIHLHPDDLAQIETLVRDGVTCIADPQVVFGGCILRGDGGGLDARLETAVEEMKAALLVTRRQRQVVAP